jgi:hypothetical protein
VERAVDRSTGERIKRPVDRWDLKGRADGVQWIKRFPRAGLAQTWREQVERGFAAGLPFDLRSALRPPVCPSTSGLPFDLRSKRFVVPQPAEGPRIPTVFELTETFYRSHPEWEPTTKRAAATSFNRARRWLLAPGADPEGADLAAVEDYLDHASFLPAHLEGQMTPGQVAGRAWLKKYSAACDGLSTMQIEAFVARFEVNQRDPSKRVGVTTIIRFLQPLKSCWAWAVARDDILVERNPYTAVRALRKGKGKTSASNVRAKLAIDADLILDVPRSISLATACAREGSWGGVVE